MIGTSKSLKRGKQEEGAQEAEQRTIDSDVEESSILHGFSIIQIKRPSFFVRHGMGLSVCPRPLLYRDLI